MNDNDELNDSAVLSAVRDSISGLPMPTAPRLEAITARGRARHRRRLAGVSVASVAACAALVVALAGGWGSAGPAPQARPAPPHHATEVQLAAFSVVADRDGSTTLTLGPGQMSTPTRSARRWRSTASRPWSRPASPPDGRPARLRRWRCSGASAARLAVRGQWRAAAPPEHRDLRVEDPARSEAQHRLPPGRSGP